MNGSTNNDEPEIKPIRGMLVTVPQLCQFMGCSAKTIREAIEAGAPIALRGSPGNSHLINSYDFLQWRDQWLATQKLGRPKSINPELDEAKSRTARAIAEKAELELARLHNEVFAVAELERFLGEAMSALRNEFVHLAQRANPELVIPAHTVLQNLGKAFAEFATRKANAGGASPAAAD